MKGKQQLPGPSAGLWTRGRNLRHEPPPACSTHRENGAFPSCARTAASEDDSRTPGDFLVSSSCLAARTYIRGALVSADGAYGTLRVALEYTQVASTIDGTLPLACMHGELDQGLGRGGKLARQATYGSSN